VEKIDWRLLCALTPSSNHEEIRRNNDRKFLMTHSLLYPRLAPLALALFFCAGLAQAQYVWIAPNGTRQYSDQPPPPDTPASKILKSPGRAAVQIDTAPAAQATAEPAAKKAPTLAEREADYRKRVKRRRSRKRRPRAPNVVRRRPTASACTNRACALPTSTPTARRAS
jgi:hypothetical protein